MSSSCRGPVEDDDRDVADPAAERLGDAPEVLGRATADVDLAGRDRADAQLLQVRVRGVDQAARLGRGEDGDRVGLAVGDEVRALERVDRDVDRRARRRGRARPADLLADVEHRRLVALALADDDRAGDLDLVHRPAHRLGRGAVGPVPVAAAHEARRRDRRRLGDADHLEREQLFHLAVPAPSAQSHWHCRSVPEVAAAGEDHRQVVAVGDLDGHLVADRAAGLDDRRHAALGRELDPVGEREVGVRGHDRELRPVAGSAERDLDRRPGG